MNSDHTNNNDNSNLFVNDYCCTARPLICKPTTICSNEILTQNTSKCIASASIVSCCMRKLVCCTSNKPQSLPLCCDPTAKYESNKNHNLIIEETTTTNTARITCCPCSPKKFKVSQSSEEVQTDFDPEFSYSDYADLAMLLNATTPITTNNTSPLNSMLSPQLPLLSDIFIQPQQNDDDDGTAVTAAVAPAAAAPPDEDDDDEYRRNFELYLKRDLVMKPYLNMINNSNSQINDHHLSASQIDPVNTTHIYTTTNNNNNNDPIITPSPPTLDVRRNSTSVPCENMLITSNISNNYYNDKIISSTANVLLQIPSIMHTNVTTYSNNNDNNNNNNTVNKYYSDSIPLRRYICRDCGVSFRQNVHLRKHIMIQHTKVKPYSCPYCEYTTVEKSHLTVHVRTHTGERPFSCRECNYSSAQNCTLKSHYLRKHPTNFIECNYCSEIFFTELELTKHQRLCRLSVRQ
ncbi:unnamed protein product [Schistosoma turkestanicum]|nr:unnamed protein product [Schistosoma turkestanicum]